MKWLLVFLKVLHLFGFSVVFLVRQSYAQDSMPPIISDCPDDIVEVVADDVTQTSVTWDQPTATDDSLRHLTKRRSHLPGSVFHLGTTEVMYTFQDESGNSAICKFNVTVSRDGDPSDVTPPVVLNCPKDIIRNLDEKNVDFVSWQQPIAVDDTTNNVIVDGPSVPGGVFLKGVTNMRYQFVDEAGNMAVCKFKIILKGAVDSTPPVVCNCPATITTTAPAGSSTAQVFWKAPTATDESGYVDISPSQRPGSSFPIGLSVVTYTFSDRTGNQASCSFAVFVLQGGRGNVDTTPPVIDDCPSDVEEVIPEYNGPVSVSWDQPIAFDDSDLRVRRERSHLPGTKFPLGTTLVTYNFTDAAGNKAVCKFKVTVKIGVDETNPLVVSNCPGTITATVPAGSSEVRVTWSAPTATDDYGKVDTNISRNPGSLFKIGPTVVTYTFADRAGNEASCSFLVFVSQEDDNQAPFISNCPTNINVNSGRNTFVRVTWMEPNATDNSGMVTKVSGPAVPSGIFPRGETTVTYVYADLVDNQAVCSFNVTVLARGRRSLDKNSASNFKSDMLPDDGVRFTLMDLILISSISMMLFAVACVIIERYSLIIGQSEGHLTMKTGKH